MTSTDTISDIREDETERPYRIFSVYMTTVGLLHFVFPAVWDRLTVLISPDHARDWTFRIGLTETIFGAMVWHRETRPFGATALIAQCIALVVRFFRLRRAGSEA